MARGARKSGAVHGPVVTALEDHVPVTYQAVGTPEWIRDTFREDALDEDQKFFVSGPKELVPVRNWLHQRKVHGIDSETTGPYIAGNKGYSMNPVNPDTRMVLFQIGDKEHAWLVEPALVPEFKAELESEDFLHALHHAIYDFKWVIVKYGVHMDRMYCSMLAEQLLTAGRSGLKVGLADTVRRYPPRYLVNKAVRSHFINLKGQITREMAYYAARDIVLMFPVMQGQIAELKAKKMEQVAQLEFDDIPATAEMEYCGVSLREDVLRLIIEYWSHREQEVGNQILDLYDADMRSQGKASDFLIPGMKLAFDLNSNAEKLSALRDLGFDLDNVKRETLKAVDHKVAALLAEYSNVTKFTTTYGQNRIDNINPHTGLWHPQFHQCGSGVMEGRKGGKESTDSTATGRYTSDAQQFPKPEKRFSNYCNDQDLPVRAHYHFAAAITAMKSKRSAKELVTA